jgi:hypothetical protein
MDGLIARAAGMLVDILFKPPPRVLRWRKASSGKAWIVHALAERAVLVARKAKVAFITIVWLLKPPIIVGFNNISSIAPCASRTILLVLRGLLFASTAMVFCTLLLSLYIYQAPGLY